ncbi:TPA: hypothetical protein DEB00_02915 [Candidatus Uhrbacteria bacterium]|nr:hypothetical protein [Candidatus Uhrbacteria bacterium]
MVYVIALLLLACSALFSGLTLGLMSLDVHDLKRKAALKDARARIVLPLRVRGNLLLTTLLLGNVAVNAILAIFLGSIASGVLASVLATGLIFLFGEILPQAIISRYAMAFGARTAWIVRILFVLFYPVAGPIAWGLDKILGEELPSVYSRHELLKVIEEHEDSHQSDIDADEERIIKGALTYSNKMVGDVMTPRAVVMLLEENQPLTPAFLKQLREAGHSRYPVYSEGSKDILGILYVKDLLGRKLTGKTVKAFVDKTVYGVHASSKLDDVLNAFIKTRHHLFIVLNNEDALVGLISVEDIIEEIVGVEIVDEFDRHIDMRELAKRRK